MVSEIRGRGGVGTSLRRLLRLIFAVGVEAQLVKFVGKFLEEGHNCGDGVVAGAVIRERSGARVFLEEGGVGACFRRGQVAVTAAEARRRVLFLAAPSESRRGLRCVGLDSGLDPVAVSSGAPSRAR